MASRTSLASAVAAFLVLAAAPVADAAESPEPALLTRKHLQLSAGPRLGGKYVGGGSGGHLGYTFANGFYVGGTFDFLVGREISSVAQGNATYTTSGSFFASGLEGGYDAAITRHVIVRPFAAVGALGSRIRYTFADAVTGERGPQRPPGRTQADLLAGFGVVLQAHVSSVFFAGAEARLLVFRESYERTDVPSITGIPLIGAHIGMAF